MNKNTGLLVIDVQMAMFNSINETCVHNSEIVLDNICYLLEQARLAGIHVVFIQHTDNDDPEYAPNTPTWYLHPKLNPRTEEQVIRKTTPDSFFDTTLHDELQKLGVNSLILVGMQTDYCVNATCRRAASLGYETIVVKDAHTTFDTSAQKAPEIIDSYNQAWSEFACLMDTQRVKQSWSEGGLSYEP